MNIVIGSDHAGYTLKKFLLEHIQGMDVKDLGVESRSTSVDYPDFATKVCKALQKKEADLGILVCGSGIGMSIAANKFSAIRAAHVESAFTARLAREHNDANVLCLGERVTTPAHALDIVEVWLEASFGGENDSESAIERHKRRIDKIHALEQENKSS